MPPAEKIKLSTIKPSPNNPRLIRDQNWMRLMDTVGKYPHFLEKRPIVIESWDNRVILAGNMRYKALRALKYKEIPAAWVKTAEYLTPEERQAFAILDNTTAGEWNFETLANEWDLPFLEQLGVFIPHLNAPGDLGDDEPDTEDLKNIPGQGNGDYLTTQEFKTVTLAFTDEEHAYFNDAFAKHGETPEAAILSLLKKADA